jgi:DNA phosphorothioation-dependent restriction protein DptG
MLIKLLILHFLNGVRDSVCGCFRFFKKRRTQTTSTSTNNKNSSSSSSSNNNNNNDKLYQRLLQSCILNGIFLLSCIIAFNYILIPLLNMIAFKILSTSNHNLVTNYFNPLIQLLFSFIWILPVFLLR